MSSQGCAEQIAPRIDRSQPDQDTKIVIVLVGRYCISGGAPGIRRRGRFSR